MIQDLFNWVQELGPWGIFTFLILCSFGLPIAKSLLLLLAGMLAQQDSSNTVAYMMAAVLGLHFGDFSLFLIGNLLGEKLFDLPVIRKLFPSKTVQKAKDLIQARGLYSLVIARLTPYIRGACYLTLGSLKMNPLKFTSINMLVCLVYAMFFFLPGYYLVTQMENLKRFSKYGNTTLFIIFAIILTGLLLRWKYKKESAKKDNEEKSKIV